MVTKPAKDHEIVEEIRESYGLQPTTGNKGENRVVPGLARRLNMVVESSDRAGTAARRAIPWSTLKRLLGGQDPRATQLADLAQATGVRAAWLLTGEGPMRPGEAAEVSGKPRKTAGFRLFGNVDLDRLKRALEGATASAGGDERRLLHLIVVLYDQLAELDEAAAGDLPPGRA